MRKALLDTDILSEVQKGIDRTVAARASDYQAEHRILTISTVTVVEVVSGYHRVGREAEIRTFLGQLPSLELVTLDGHSAELAGRIQADLLRAGRGIGWADPLIAAIALRHDLTLVTGNTAHYQRIRELGYPLRLENWRLA